MNHSQPSRVIVAFIVAVAGCGTYEPNVTSESSAICQNVKLTLSPLGTTTVGTTVSATASGHCSKGSPEYRFWLGYPNGVWTVIQNWSASDTFNWSTTGYINGAYQLNADVRTAGGVSWEDSSKVETITLTGGSGGPCTAVALDASPASPQAAGTAVTWTATGTCPTGTVPEYRFWVMSASGGWYLAQDWSTSSTYAWATGSLVGGNYAANVDIREQGGAASLNASSPVQSYTLTGGPLTQCAAATLTASLASPQAPGATVTWTAASTCPTGSTAEYRFWIMSASGNWVVAQDWSTATSYAWPTTGLDGGNYAADVDVRRQGASMLEASSPVQSFTLTGSRVVPPTMCTVATLAASPASPQAPGATVTWTAGSTCPTGTTAEYRFWIMAPGGNWVVAQDWSTTASYNWSTTGLGGGNYAADVDVRRQGTSMLDLSSPVQSFSLTGVASGPCSSVTLSVSPPSPAPAGTALTLSAAGVCGPGTTAEYRFWRLAPGGSWTIAQDWSTSATAPYVAPSAGDYSFMADVRRAGTTSYDATSATLVYTMQ
jgi:hypothetical protein